MVAATPKISISRPAANEAITETGGADARAAMKVQASPICTRLAAEAPSETAIHRLIT